MSILLALKGPYRPTSPGQMPGLSPDSSVHRVPGRTTQSQSQTPALTGPNTGNNKSRLWLTTTMITTEAAVSRPLLSYLDSMSLYSEVFSSLCYP